MWIIYMLAAFFHYNEASILEDAVTYRSFGEVYGSPFSAPVMGQKNVVVHITTWIYNTDNPNRRFWCEVDLYTVGWDFDDKHPFDNIYQLGDHVYYHCNSENKYKKIVYNHLIYRADRFRGRFIHVVDRYYAGVSSGDTYRTGFWHDYKYIDIQYQSWNLNDMVGKYGHMYCPKHIHSNSKCVDGNTTCLPGWSGDIYSINHKDYNYRRLDGPLISTSTHQECNVHLLCQNNTCPNNDCHQHSPINYYCRSWFDISLVEKKSKFYIGDTVTCHTKIADGETMPGDLALDQFLEANNNLIIDPRYPSRAKLKNGPMKHEVVCVLKVGILNFKHKFMIEILATPKPCYIHPPSEFEMEKMVFNTHTSLQFTIDNLDSDNVNVKTSIRYAKYRAGVILHGTKLTFNTLAANGLYIISCTSFIKNTTYRITVNHPIQISRPSLQIEKRIQHIGHGEWKCPQGSFLTSTTVPSGVIFSEDLVTVTETARGAWTFVCLVSFAEHIALETTFYIDIFGPPTFVSINTDDNATDSHLKCVSNAYPLTLTLNKWKIQIGDVIEDNMFSYELHLWRFAIPDNKPIIVRCTVMYFGPNGIYNMSAEIEYSVKETESPMFVLEVASTERNVNTIYLLCLLLSWIPALYILLILNYWNVLFDKREPNMTLNLLFYIKYPQAMRRFRDSLMTEKLIERMHTEIGGLAYFRNWRFSRENRLSSLPEVNVEQKKVQSESSNVNRLQNTLEHGTLSQTQFKLVNEIYDIE